MAILPGSLGVYADLFVWKSTPWRERAACRAFPSWWWFESGQTKHSENVRTKAKRVCESCPVRWQCLGRFLAEPDGIYGGLDFAERRALIPTIPVALRRNSVVLRTMVMGTYQEDDDGTLRVS